MKTEEEIRKKAEQIAGELDTERNPLQFIYGKAQLRALTWVLEKSK